MAHCSFCRFRRLHKLKVFAVIACVLTLGYVASLLLVTPSDQIRKLIPNGVLNHSDGRTFSYREGNAEKTYRNNSAKTDLDKRLPVRTPPTHGIKQRDIIAGKKVIRIIKWTPPHKNWVRLLGRKLFKTCHTPIPCEYVPLSSYNTSDIIMINAFYLRYEHDMPLFRFPHQKWLFYHTEAPRRQRFKHLQRYHTAFNLTMTYSSDADIVQPYGICLPNRATIKNNPSLVTQYIRKVYGGLTDSVPWLSRENPDTSSDLASGKNRLVAWMASDCTAANSRSDYVALLQRHIPIDIYGTCGNLTCLPKFSKECDVLLQSYKFYLAFENSFCPEYITEKVWMRLREGTVVPIVLGSAEYEKFLPKHSYINIRDFSSPRLLANYIKLLDKNDTLYNQYFQWKKHYTCHLFTPGSTNDCHVCRHANENINKVETASNIAEFWSFDKCMSPKEYYNGIADMNV